MSTSLIRGRGGDWGRRREGRWGMGESWELEVPKGQIELKNKERSPVLQWLSA